MRQKDNQGGKAVLAITGMPAVEKTTYSSARSIIVNDRNHARFGFVEPSSPNQITTTATARGIDAMSQSEHAEGLNLVVTTSSGILSGVLTRSAIPSLSRLTMASGEGRNVGSDDDKQQYHQKIRRMH